ncbi:caspase domain-containing protein [Gigaspora rosea]|uniref:Caspase domain-containing protein n=1 Tax=Gigaspora rosea TaxID=44941 RepID=A0A397UKB4_9GLOM|nr:caspase domain-containing protein [Gigaspora rosea]
MPSPSSYTLPPTVGYATPSGPPSGGHIPPSGPPSGGYSPPPGPPSGYTSPSGGYTPPPGLPPNDYTPPPGPPSGGYTPPPGPPSGGYAPPQGLPSSGYIPPLQKNVGHKKALLIGINYFSQQAELKGCINDVANLKKFLIEVYGFQESNMVILTDDQKDPTRIPTKTNILAAMKWLVQDAQPGDSLFFHYSGHGSQEKDSSGDEYDGNDETIVPVDYSQNGQITDDVMHETMVKPLQAGVKFFSIFDSCHSGSALDLPYTYSTRGMIKAPKELVDSKKELMSAGMALLSGNKKQLMSFVKQKAPTIMKTGKNLMSKSSKADVIMLSGCKDEQTSADAYEEGRSTGAMSFAFIKTMSANRNITYQQLLNNIRDVLASKYTQKPQLSTSHPINMNSPFIM